MNADQLANALADFLIDGEADSQGNLPREQLVAAIQNLDADRADEIVQQLEDVLDELDEA